MVGSMKLLFTVNVLIPPKITNIPENDDEITDENYVSETLTIVNGESINLKCPIVGNPDPEIVWIQIEYSPEGEVTKNILTENGNELVIRLFIKHKLFFNFFFLCTLRMLMQFSIQPHINAMQTVLWEMLNLFITLS